MKIRLGQMLVKSGVISSDELDEALIKEPDHLRYPTGSQSGSSLEILILRNKILLS